jgi:hypothetical protein
MHGKTTAPDREHILMIVTNRKGQSRMDNPEKTEGAIKNGQSQRKPKGQSRMDNPEKTEGAIKNGQSRETLPTARAIRKIRTFW